MDDKPSPLPLLEIKKGIKEQVSLEYEETFRYLDTSGKAVTDVKKNLSLPDTVEAPVKKGTQAGEMVYYMGEKILGSVRILYAESVKKATYKHCLRTLFMEALL